MNLTRPIQYNFLDFQGMTSKVNLAPKNREYQKSAQFESLWALFERKSGKKVPRWHNFPKKLLSELAGNATFGLFWQGFCSPFSILRIAAGERLASNRWYN
jgi:hypothetical protein